MNENRSESATVAADPKPDRRYKRLTVDVENCTGCRCCEFACSLRNYQECNPSRARIYVVRSQVDGVVTTVPVTCQQCEDPLCVAMCPASALSRSAETRAVVVDADKCLGCRTCVEVCPFGAPSVDPRTGKAEKCDLCGGDPVCVKVCSQQALTFIDAEEEGLRRKRSGVEKYLDHLNSIAALGA